MTLTMRPRVYWNSLALPLEEPDSGDWIEITDWVKQVDLAHGRPKGSADFQPGSGSITLDNRDGRFDPSNEDSPYYPNWTLRRHIRVDAYVEDDGTPLTPAIISYGYIEQLPQQWSFRFLVDTEVTWTDALGLLANHDLPDSVWDHAIRQHCEAGRVVVWHRWGDTNEIAVDSSGNGYHGRYVVSEAGLDPVTLGNPAPLPVVEAGEVKSIIPQVDRPSLSVGKMVAETGQPASSSPDGWRFPSMVCHPATELWGQDFSVETWVLYRSAFSMNAAGLADPLTPRPQWVAFWGNPKTEAIGFGVGLTLGDVVQPYADASTWTTTGEFLLPISSSTPFSLDTIAQLDDGIPHHCVWRVSAFTSSEPADYWRIEYFFDGVEISNSLLPLDEFPKVVGRPMEIGRQFIHPYPAFPVSGEDGAFASTLGDVVVYNETLTDQQIEDNYVAGFWGRLSGTGEVLSGTAIDQALEMAGWEQFVASDAGDKHVAAGKIRGRGVSDFVREVARSEDGLMYQTGDGILTYSDEGWQRNPLLGGTVRFTLTDDDSGLTGLVVGYGECDFAYDDRRLANSWDVDWDGGTAHSQDDSSIAVHGRYEQSISTLLTESGNADDLAAFRVWQFAQPQFDVGDVSFDALAGDDHIESVFEWCDIGRRVRLIRTRPNGSTIDGEYFIMSVRHRIEPGNGEWQVTLGLEAADEPGDPFIVGTSTVDGDDVLWY
jgi:hypothetical protein